MSEQASPQIEVYRDLTHKLQAEVFSFESREARPPRIRMNALTYVELLKQCTTEVSRHYYRLLKQNHVIVLVNTMDKNRFELI